MAILEVLTIPDPRLRDKAEPVAAVDDGIRALMDDMLETMYAEKGIGLAAIQVGVKQRVIVMDLEQRDEGGKGNPLYMANPEIVWESDETNDYDEGCLSVPGQYSTVTRPKRVRVQYLDYNGAQQVVEADELFATCVQHEIDHLNGVVFIDHISRLKRDMIVRKLIKAKKEGTPPPRRTRSPYSTPTEPPAV